MRSVLVWEWDGNGRCAGAAVWVRRVLILFGCRRPYFSGKGPKALNRISFRLHEMVTFSPSAGQKVRGNMARAASPAPYCCSSVPWMSARSRTSAAAAKRAASGAPEWRYGLLAGAGFAPNVASWISNPAPRTCSRKCGSLSGNGAVSPVQATTAPRALVCKAAAQTLYRMMCRTSGEVEQAILEGFAGRYWDDLNCGVHLREAVCLKEANCTVHDVHHIACRPQYFEERCPAPVLGPPVALHGPVKNSSCGRPK